LGVCSTKVKYASGDPKILFDEKLREDDLRDQGWELVRWTSADVEGSFWAVEGDFALRSREAAAVKADGTPRARLRSPLHQILSEMPVFPVHSGRGVMLQGLKSCGQSARSGRQARGEGP
jgi:hypothetical protein